MRSLLTFGFITLLALNSCSSKNQTPQTQAFPGPVPVKLLDTDRDGLSDPFEKKIGRSSSVASFPSFAREGKVQTRLTFSHKSVATEKLTWQTTKDSTASALNRPHRTQMARQAFKRKFKFEKNDKNISFSPLPKFNLTEILFHQWHKFKNFPLFDHTTLSLETTLPVRLINMKGIKDVNKITARVGFYENNNFISLTHRFILKNETGKAISLGDRKNTTVIFININIERKQLIQKLLQNQKQIILEFCDFEVTTQESSHYNFSEQWNYANKVLRPLLLTTPQKDSLVLVDKKLNFRVSLKKIAEHFRVNREEKIESVNGLSDETTGLNLLSKMDSQELQEHAWFQFKQENLYALAYLSNLELAQAQQKLVAHNLFKIRGNQYKKSLGKIRLGELLTIKFKGSYKVATPIRREIRENISYQEYIISPSFSRCPNQTCDGGSNGELSDTLPRRILIQKETSCIKTTQEAQWTEETIHSPSLFFFEAANGEEISLIDLYEITGARPITNKSNNEFEIQFSISENFITRYGNELKIKFHDMRTYDKFDVGTIDAIKCEQTLPSNFNYSAQFGDKYSEMFEQNNDIQLDFNKRF